MWYVIQTLKGKEERLTEEIRREVAQDNEEVFVFENEKMFRIHGKWEPDRKPLFPGYIFVNTDKVDDFDERLMILRKKNKPLKFISTDGVITPIRSEEEEYLKLLGGDDHLVKYSEGYRVGDKIEIESGSLKGFTGTIKKLDRHNRRAKIEIFLFGKSTEVELGLGIVKSIPQDAVKQSDAV